MNTSTIRFRPQTPCCSEPLFEREAKCNRKGFALSSLVSKVKVYGTQQKLPIVDKSLVATAQASPEGGEGVLLGILGGGVPDPISDQKMSFSIPVFRPDL